MQKLITNDSFSSNVRNSMDVVCSKNLWMLKLEKLGVIERTLTKSSFKLTIKKFIAIYLEFQGGGRCLSTPHFLN